LLLADREQASTLSHFLGISLIQLADELVRVRHLGCGLYVFIRGTKTPVPDIIPHAAREEMRRLKHHTDARLDRMLRKSGIVDPIDADCTIRRLVESADQVDDRRLAATGRPNHGDVLTRSNVQAEIREDILILLVPEPHVVKLNLAADVPRVEGVLAVHHIRRGIDKRKHAFCRSDGALHLSVDTGHILDGPHHEHQIAQEGLQASDR